jgi:hypothetical protein
VRNVWKKIKHHLWKIRSRTVNVGWYSVLDRPLCWTPHLGSSHPRCTDFPKINDASAAVRFRRTLPLLFYCDKDSFSTDVTEGINSSLQLWFGRSHSARQDAGSVHAVVWNTRGDGTSRAECGTNLFKKKGQLSLTFFRRRMKEACRLKVYE